MSEKEKLDLPKHRLDTYKHQVNNHLAKLQGKKDLIINPKPLEITTNGKLIVEFIEQLKKYRPKLTYDSLDGADYLLNFMFEEGNTEESLAYYEKYSDKLENGNFHINASRLFLKTSQIEKAKKAVLTYATKCWYPVEHIQVTPMPFLGFEDLYPILTDELKEEILQTPKAKNERNYF